MADQSDVEMALVGLVANALYPDGTASPSVIGNLCRVYRGSPTAPSLDADLASGTLHVSIVGDAPVTNVTRYPRIWRAVLPVPATLIVEFAGQRATFTGACTLGQLAGIILNGSIFPYAVQANDTPPTIASNLAALLRIAGWLVDYTGTTVAVPGAEMFSARVVNGAGALQEIKRQMQRFRVTLWCPDPSSRDAAALVIDQALATFQFIALADGSSARVIFSGTESLDTAADATLYRRDIFYNAEYPTTLAQISPAMLFGTGSFHANAVFVENLRG
jgi:hypothetical protein